MDLERNHARVYAAGFYAVLIEPKTRRPRGSCRDLSLTLLKMRTGKVYEHGSGNWLVSFSAIGDRTSVPAAELRQLVLLLLKTTPPVG